MKLFLIALLVAGANAIFEGYDEKVKELKEDPSAQQMAEFRKHILECYKQIYANQTQSGQEVNNSTRSICCFRELLGHCMRRVPLLITCKTTLEPVLERFQTAITEGHDCSTVDLTKCPGKFSDGAYDEDESVGDPERFSSAVSNCGTLVTVIVAALLSSLLGRTTL